MAGLEDKPVKVLIYKPGLDDGSQNEIPNLGMGILAAELTRIGYEITIYDGHLKKMHKKFIRELLYKSGIICLSLTSQEWELKETQWVIDEAFRQRKITIIGGPHAYAYYDILCYDERIDQIVVGEVDGQIEKTLFVKNHLNSPVINKIGKAKEFTAPNFTNLIGKEDMLGYPLYTSRGCTNLCLTGDTTVHTIEGDFPISSLVGKETKVLSRDPDTQEPVYTQAIHIRKTQEMAKIVRVHFTDGSHIDCTPDHKFKVFRPKNQYVSEIEFDVEAQDLRPKQQVRAVMFQELGGRTSILTRRNIRKLRSRTVMESIIGRKLEKGEWVHHKDHDKSNDLPCNLELTKDILHIPYCHPEASQRMKKNNPVRNIPTEKLRENGKKNIGKKRSIESRMKYRESKLGNKNPNYIEGGVHTIQKSRIPEINHKVSRIEYMIQREDVYCMEVPGIEWFYANKVLVHNCSFCMGGKIHRGWRPRQIREVFEELKNLEQFPKLRRVYVIDDCFSADIYHARLFLSRWYAEGWSEKYELSIMNVRADQIDAELLYLMALCGVKELPIGVESADPTVFKYVGKGETLEDIRKAISTIQNAGITPWLNMIVGLPLDNQERHQNSLNWVLGIDHPRIVHWFQFSPFRKTKAYDWCLKQGVIEDGFIPNAYGRKYDEFPWFPSHETEDFSKVQRARAQLEGYLACGSPILINTPNLWKVSCELGLGKAYRNWEEIAPIKEYTDKHLKYKVERGQL